MGKAPEDKTTYDAPVGSIDLAAFNSEGEPYQIWGCNDCLPWHAEVIREDDGVIIVREWHAVGCETFRSLLAEDQDDAD
jgi:hypothetical protein